MQPVKIAGVWLLLNLVGMSLYAQEQLNARVKDSLPVKGIVLKNKVKEVSGRLLTANKELVAPAAVKLSDITLEGLTNEAVKRDMIIPKVSLFSKTAFLGMRPGMLDVEYTFIEDAGDAGLMNNKEGTYSYNFQAGINIAAMPFDFYFKGVNGLSTTHNSSFDKLTRLNFDHQAYMEQLQKKVLEKVSPDAVLAASMKRINSIRSNYEKMLRREIEVMRNDFSKEFKEDISFPAGLTDLSTTDLSSLKSKLMTETTLHDYELSETRLQQAMKNGYPGSEDSLFKKDLATVKKKEVLEKSYQKVLAWKERFESNQVVKELKKNLPFTPGSFKSYINSSVII